MWVRCLLLASLVIPLSALVSSSQSNPQELLVGHIHIRVKDVERTKAFYRDKLGFKVTSERAGEMVEFENGKLWFGKWQGSGELQTASITIGVEATNVQAAYEMLKQRGVDIPKPPQQQSFGKSFRLHDPDGYEIEVEGERN